MITFATKLQPRFLALGIFVLAGFAGLDTFAQTATNTTFPATVGGSLPDAAPSMLRVFGALILVIAIFLGGVWLFRNWRRLALRKGGAAKLNVIEVKSLGQRQALFVVGYQQQRMLLASSPTGVTLLSHLPAAGEEPEATEPVAPRMSFTEAFQQVLSRKA